MGRKTVSRSLAQLPPASSLTDRGHRTDRLLEILRSVALKNQKEQSQTFYSVRDVAARFRVPLSSVSQIYRHLEKEGLLSRVRSSKTVLQGLDYDRRLSVRAFVGLPALFSAFMTIQDYRMFFIRIRRKLRLRRFASAMLFFDQKPIEMRAMSERLKTYEVDTVIWFQPPIAAKETLLRLSDLGIRILRITDGTSAVLPSRYEIRRDGAIRKLVCDWRTLHEIEKITIVQSKDYRSPANEASLDIALKEFQVRRDVLTFKGQRADSFIRSIQNSKNEGIVFASAALASMLACRRPRAVTELLKTKRVAFLGGPVNMPFARLPDVKVDLVTFDWQVMTKSIVDDLITQRAFQTPGSTIFEAQAHLRVPLSRFAQNI
jgi:hypothetical protein